MNGRRRKSLMIIVVYLEIEIGKQCSGGNFSLLYLGSSVIFLHDSNSSKNLLKSTIVKILEKMATSFIMKVPFIFLSMEG